MRTLLGLFFILSSMNASAADIQAKARAYINACGYYSNRISDVQLQFTQAGLPHDAVVQLIYGLGNSDQNRDWEQRTVISTYKVGLTSTRQADISVQIASRGQEAIYKKLQFVWEIKNPNGDVYHDKGSTSMWGFYELNFPTDSSCVSPMIGLPQLNFVQLKTVDRN